MSNYGGGYNNKGYTDQNPYAGAGEYNQPRPYNQSSYQPQQQYQQQYPQQQGSYGYGNNQQDSYNNGQQGIELQNFPPGQANDVFEAATDINNQVAISKQKMETILNLQRAVIGNINLDDVAQKRTKIEALSTELKSYNQEVITQLRKYKGKFGTEHRPLNRSGEAFKELVQWYREQERLMLAKADEETKRQLKVTNPALSDEEMNRIIESGDTKGVFQQGVMSSRRLEAQSALNNVRNRHAEIQDIERKMVELLEMFSQMNEMIIEQEVKVERIQEGAQETHEHIEEGVKQLEVAKEKAKSARRKKWWCLLIVVILIIIIIVVIMVTVVKPIIQGTNNKRSLEYLAHSRRSIIDQQVRRSFPPQARRALLE